MMRTEKGGEGEGGGTGGADGDKGIDHHPMLLGAQGQGSIEAGPVHPQENGPDHRKDIPVVGGLVVGVVLGALDLAQRVGERQSKDCPKEMDHHASPHVHRQEVQECNHVKD